MQPYVKTQVHNVFSLAIFNDVQPLTSVDWLNLCLILPYFSTHCYTKILLSNG